MNVNAIQARKWRPGRRMRQNIASKFGEATVTQTDVASFDIAPADRLWLLLHMVTPKARRLAAAQLADRAITVSGATDPGLLAVPDVIRGHANGTATDGELETARAAAVAAVASATSETLAEAARTVAAASVWIVEGAVDPGLPAPEFRARTIGKAFRAWKQPARVLLKTAHHCADTAAWNAVWQVAWQAEWEAARATTPALALLPSAYQAAFAAAQDNAWNTIVTEARDRVDAFLDSGPTNE